MPKRASATQLTASPISMPPLKKGERWVGIVSTGRRLHHVVLMPGEFKLNWNAAIALAKDKGAAVPSRLEQSLLLAEAKDEFKPDWYWSGDQYEPYDDFAWIQYFVDGAQYYHLKSLLRLVRLVRRVVIR